MPNDNHNNNRLQVWVLIIGVLVIMGASAAVVVWTVRQSLNQAQQAIQPVSDLTSNVATQVAQVLHPTPTILPDPITIIRSVRDLARLETIQYTVEKVITAESRQGPFGFLFGDRLILVAHGIVLAGVDLGKLNPDDIWVQGGVLYVRLPQPEIFLSTLDNDQSYIFDRDIGVLTHGNINLETTARQAAEREIEQAALNDGILDKASRNAETYLYQLLGELGYPEVIFVQPDISPTPTPVDEG